MLEGPLISKYKGYRDADYCKRSHSCHSDLPLPSLDVAVRPREVLVGLFLKLDITAVMSRALRSPAFGPTLVASI